MDNSNTPAEKEKTLGFAGFAAKRIIIGVVLAVAGLWVINQFAGLLNISPSSKTSDPSQTEIHLDTGKSTEANQDVLDFHDKALFTSHDTASEGSRDTMDQTGKTHGIEAPVEKHGYAASQTKPSEKDLHAETPAPSGSPVMHKNARTVAQAPAAKTEVTHGTTQGTQKDTNDEDATGHHPFRHDDVKKAKGVVFVEALIEPLHYEINERWGGWRPNDIIKVTDNINNMQLGVLELTRRTSIVLLEKMSRTGATASFDPNLQQAMNWFMIDAYQYWLPSPEDKYNEGLDELRKYRDNLEKGEAAFYTRNDNIIPLLSVYEDLLGGCEESLVRQTDEDGEPISYFEADDNFYYSKGVATAMLYILEAISVNFAATIEDRRGTDVLHHAIEALHHASEIEPFIITNSDLDGILANHRANLAAPISHARFYLGVLIKTLST